MKKIYSCLFIVFILLFSQLSLHNSTDAEVKYYYTKNVDHLFTHCLISYPEITFKSGNYMKKYYENDCITSLEFSRVLQQLYDNNYVLVSIYDCFEVNNGIAVKKDIKVPINKKPIIFSFDDVNYDTKKLGKGMVDKIILDNDGNIATSTIVNGKEEISYNREFISILENFIKHNPSFSPSGARGTINLTGYDGILGYRTSHTNKVNRETEIQNATAVSHKLKELGWTFACHSYGHYHMNKISTEKFKQELTLWKDEVESIIGKTNIYVYPYGEWQVFDNGNLCEKHKLLNEFGFNLFCGVGMKTFYSYLPNKQHKVLFMDRKCVDGAMLKCNSKQLHQFFNPLTVLDPIRNKYI